MDFKAEHSISQREGVFHSISFTVFCFACRGYEHRSLSSPSVDEIRFCHKIVIFKTSLFESKDLNFRRKGAKQG